MQPNTQVKFYHAERRSKSNKVSMGLERIERRFKLSFIRNEQKSQSVQTLDCINTNGRGFIVMPVSITRTRATALRMQKCRQKRTSFVRAILEHIMLIFQSKQSKHIFSRDSEQEQIKTNIQESQRLASYLQQELVFQNQLAAQTHIPIQKSSCSLTSS